MAVLINSNLPLYPRNAYISRHTRVLFDRWLGAAQAASSYLATTQG